jgi:acetyl-CoA carboxylase biotin carboxyl carrier protein
MNEDILTLRTEALGDGSGWRVLCPAVGLYAQAPREGSAFRAGEDCGCLVVLDRVHRLQLPTGVAGFVASSPPERKHQPVGYGDLLFELRRASDAEGFGANAAEEAQDPSLGLVVRAPQAGRFYRRSAADSPVFAETGETIQVGRTLGLLEVMKTFNPVKYTATGALPESAQIVRFLVDDASDVEEGQALLEVAPSA